ncbi:MAG: succinate dehydrogenase, cytochrome b556 subunit [Anaerolineae bacterium]
MEWLGKVARGWFNARGRHVGMWAFVLNRLSGLLLVAYLMVHLMVLSLLAGGPVTYDRFVSFASHPVVILFDIALIGLLLYHGLNGVRLILLSLGVCLNRQGEVFWGLMGVGGVLWLAVGFLLVAHLL